ncbi:MAG: CBS domain-containing protein, partial [Rhodospirillaceae bacterium]
MKVLARDGRNWPEEIQIHDTSVAADRLRRGQEEMNMIRKIVPDVIKDQTLVCISPADTVRAAARLMTERKVAAVLVMESERLVGIITERDMTSRVIAADRHPDSTKCRDIMTAN